jgi:protein TonB
MRRLRHCGIALQQIERSDYGGTETVQNATRKGESAAPETAAAHKPTGAAKRAKLSVFLITGDEMLWPQIGPHIGPHFILKQVDSVDELVSAAAAGQPAVILWDARGQVDASAVFSRLQLHSPRFAVVALDDARNSHAWTNPIALRQVITLVAVPIAADSLKAALASAHEEVNARSALLGDDNDDAAGGAGGVGEAGGAAARAKPGGARRIPWVPAAAILAVLAGAGSFVMLRYRDVPAAPDAAVKPVPEPRAPARPPTAADVKPATADEKPAAADEKVELLIEKAQRAMLDRHFIDPAEGSALTLYRSAMLLEPGNGEARQGLQRLAEILYARVQSALDERKIDVALQALETVRSIDPGDARLAPLDARIVAMRAELGAAKLAQQREELRRRREEADAAALRAQTLEINKRATAALHAVTAARSAPIAAAPEQPPYLDPRVVQGQLLDQARAALDANQPARAESAGGAPAVVEAALTPVKRIQPDYPDRALRDGIEGWVELSFMVTTDGKVTKAAVLDSNPKGTFDSAALRAISRARYRPWLQGGKPTEVSSKVRISFHLSQDGAAR